MIRCIVKNCGNYPGKSGVQSDVQYFLFPDDPVRFDLWRRTAGCGPLSMKGKYYMCSTHFVKSEINSMANGPLTIQQQTNRNPVPPIHFVNAGRELLSPAPKMGLAVRSKQMDYPLRVESTSVAAEEESQPLQPLEDPFGSIEETTETETDGNVVWMVPETQPEPENDQNQIKIGNSSCRLCLTKLSNIEMKKPNLFQTIDGYGCVAESVLTMFQINLHESPQLSSKVCSACLMILQSIRAFKDRIESSQKIISQGELRKNSENVNDPASESDSDCFLPEPSVNQRPREKKAHERIERTHLEKAQLEELMKTMNLLKCDVCADETNKYESFFALVCHQVKEHPPTYGYLFCCGSRWSYDHLAHDHLEFHKNPEAFKCWPCNEKFMCHADLKTHQKTHKTAIREMLCEMCGYKCRTSTRLRDHQVTHMSLDERPDKCSSCDQSFATRESLKRHVSRIHDVNKEHMCDKCGKTYSSACSLWTHRRFFCPLTGIKRLDRPRKICSVCHKEARNLNTHMRLVHKIHSRSEEEIQEIPCSTCGKVLPRYRMAQHVYLQHNTKECKFCPKTFISHPKWKAHMNEHLGLKFPCQYCEKVCKTSLARYHHIRSCHRENMKKKEGDNETN